MSLELYFLRSSEQKIVTDMLKVAYELNLKNKNLYECAELAIYHNYYGLTPKDLGLYVLFKHKIAGAIWTRKLTKEDNSNAFVDENTPVLHITVLPELRAQGIGSSMIEQFLQEAGAIYAQISVSVKNDSPEISFYEKFGFVKVENSEKKAYMDESRVFTMLKTLEQKEVVRPSDGYDPRKWMD
jgi:ribosomal protein S18 acetylase RimI-like enzyme